MKTNFTIQVHGNDYVAADVEKLVKEELKNQGVKVTGIKTLDLYFKPIERECYYVAVSKDGEVTGKVNC
ncbi:MAG: DUF6465 family protein [Erysipelotrichaceae bacterium]|nr:DUF6465 family protein [Erysipelotrichaceae bacterium]